jgi:hypothetical protein
MTSGDIRRAAGTQTFTDILKSWMGIKQVSPAQDYADFAAGVTLKVACFLRPLAAASAQHRQGGLYLTAGEAITWRPWRGKQSITVTPPLALTDSAEKPRQFNMRAFILVSGSGAFSVQIPMIDVPLVQRAFAAQSL